MAPAIEPFRPLTVSADLVVFLQVSTCVRKNVESSH